MSRESFEVKLDLLLGIIPSNLARNEVFMTVADFMTCWKERSEAHRDSCSFD